MIKLVSCVCVAVAAVFVKALFPDYVSELRADALRLIGGSVDYKAALTVMGEAVTGEKKLGDALAEAYEYAFTITEGDAIEASAIEDEPVQKEASEKESDNPAEKAEKPISGEKDDKAHDNDTPTVRNLTYIHTGDASPPEGASYAMASISFEYCMPVNGTLTSGFGYRDHPVDGEVRFHYGTDFGAEEGTDILSFGDGTVYAVGESSTLGLYVMIDHADGVRTIYGHCSSILVSGGDAVKMGEKIAEVGSTGNATGNCLHLEIEVNGINVDPEYYLTWV